MNAGQEADATSPEPPGQGAAYRVTMHGPGQVGEGNTQIIASHTTNVTIGLGTWTDGVAPPPLADATGTMKESPYRGLAAFGEQDAGFFFGRDEAAGQVRDRLSGRLSRPGLLMVSGVSGAGKSSLLQAGLLPLIRDSGLVGAPEAAEWPCAVLTPTRKPLAGLAGIAALARIDAATTHQALKTDPTDFALTARQVADFQPPDTSPAGPTVAGRGPRLLLIVDQFEQLFTQCPDEDQRQAYLTALHAAATARHNAGGQPAAMVVLVVRSDFESPCAEYPLLADAVQDRYLVAAMTERQLRMAITEPAKKAGSHVDDDLVTALLDDTRSRAPGTAALAPGPGMPTQAGILPLLSHALDTAWRARVGTSLTVADYERAGGIERAVADSADSAYGALTAAQQAAARTIFLRLTATGPDGTVTAGRAARTELLHGTDPAQARDMDAVLELFARERLLTLAAGTVEISHEVLLRAWPLLRDQWLASIQADRIVRTRLRAAASEWNRSGRDLSYLYTGTLLRDAVRTTARAGRTRQPEPGPVEQEFLSASTRARRRSVTVRRRAVAVVLSLAVGLAAVAVVAYYASQDAARQHDAALASQLATESEAQAATNPAASEVESLAAWQADPTAQSWYALVSAADRPVPGALADYSGVVYKPGYSVAFSRDRTMMAAADGRTVRLWNVATGQQIGRTLTIASTWASVTAVAFSPDGRTLATGDDGGAIQLWDTATGRPAGRPLTVASMGAGTPVSLAFSPDGRTLAAGEMNGTSQLWQVATWQEIGGPLTISSGGGPTSVTFSPDSRTLAAGDERTVRLWNTATGHQTGRDITTSAFGNDVMAFSPDGRTLATGGQDPTTSAGTVQLWNTATGHLTGRTITVSATGTDRPQQGIIAVVFSPDSRTLATGSTDDTVQLWNTATGQQTSSPLRFTTASDPGFYTVAFTPDGQALDIGVQDGMVWRQDLTRRETGIPVFTAVDPDFSTVGETYSLAFAPNGQTLAAIDNDDRVRLWNAATGQQTGRPITGSAVSGDPDTAGVAFSPDSRVLAVGGQALDSSQGTVELWNAVTQQPVRTLTVNTNTTFNSVQFSPDGKTVAAGGDTLFPGADGGTVGLWNTATGQQIGQIEDARNGGLFEGLTFSPDGQTLATISDTVRLWNVATRRQTGKPLTVADEAISPDVVAFSPDGHTLAVGYNDGTVRLWNPATQRQVGQPITAGADWPVDAMAFSPDGQTLAVGDTGGTVRLWNAATGQQIGQPLTAGKEGINGVAFRPNGRTLVTASADGIRVWDVSPLADPLTQVCGQLGGDLSTAWSQYVPAGLAYNGVCP